MLTIFSWNRACMDKPFRYVDPFESLTVGITGVAQQITVQNSILLDSVDSRKCECPQTRRGISPLLS
jgi:hypothetical protein